MVNYTAIVLAAGQGKRMRAGKNKQFVTIGTRPLIVRTLEVFVNDDWCEQIILVGNVKELNELTKIIHTEQFTKPIMVIQGGEERQQSVYEGLKRLSTEPEKLVLIHDGARPFVPIQLVHDVLEKAKEQKAAILAVPVKDTIKKVKHQVVSETLDRSGLWAVQTPQAFHCSIIKKAHEEALQKGFIGTDDASLLEFIGQPVSIVEGSYFNIKLTTPEDLIFAEAIINSKEK